MGSLRLEGCSESEIRMAWFEVPLMEFVRNAWWMVVVGWPRCGHR